MGLWRIEVWQTCPGGVNAESATVTPSPRARRLGCWAVKRCMGNESKMT